MLTSKKKRTLAVIANYDGNIRIITLSVYNHLKIIFSIEAYIKDVFVPCLYMTSKKRKNDIAHEMQIEHPFYLVLINMSNIFQQKQESNQQI